MKAPLVMAVAASLLAGACNMADGQRERESASRKDRGEADSAQELRTSERQRREPVRKLEEAGVEPQLVSSPAPDAGGLNRAWFAGRWTDTGDCAQAGLFSPDGTFNLADGSRGMWNIRAGRLVVQGKGGRSEVQLRRVDDDTIEVLNGDGTAGRSIRC